MNRDNVLFLVIGVMAGFITGYVMHEAMASRQPPRRAAATAAVAATAAAAGNPSPRGAPAGAPQAPMMAEVQQLTARVAEDPTDTVALRRLANLNYDISNWQRAAELYESYLALEPADLGVMTDLGATYRFLGRPDDALGQFQSVRELDPEHWQSRYNEILVLGFDLGDLEAARSAMEELSRLQPDNPDVARLVAELEKRSQGP